MGNRAVITDDLNGIGVYLHWNGGPDSVGAFLEYCRLRGFRSPTEDRAYAYARLVQVIANFFGGGLSVGIDLCRNLDCDNGDNGTYIVGAGWKLIGHKYGYGGKEGYDRNEMLKAIDEKQPETERLDAYLDAQEVNTSDLKLGDTVVFISWDGSTKTGKVAGYGDGWVNGQDMTGKPYLDCYGDEHKQNINNYIRTATARVKRD